MIQPGYGAYVPTPPVVTWYKAYTIVMALMYLVVMILGILFLVDPGLVPPDERKDLPPMLMGMVYLVMGFFFMIPFIIAPFLPARPWVWVYGIVMIALGMTSCCCLPASIPLLIYWLKPDVKEYFGKPA